MTDRPFVITTEDGAIELGVSDGYVCMQFTTSALGKMRTETAAAKPTGGGLPNRFARFVVGNVENLIERRIEYDLSDIKAVSYEDDMLRFQYTKKRLLSFESVRVGKRRTPVLASFAPKDAAAFVTAVYKAKELGVRTVASI